MPALRASRLVWAAMLSITLMILLIWREDSSISPIAPTAWVTTSPDRAASILASRTDSEAWAAPWAVRRTVSVISSRAAAVSSSPAACCSLRRDSSSEARAIAPVPASMLFTASPTEASRLHSRVRVALKLVFRPSCRGETSAVIWAVRSPSATASRAVERAPTMVACSASLTRL